MERVRAISLGKPTEGSPFKAYSSTLAAFLTEGATIENSRSGEVSEGREALSTAGRERALQFLATSERCALEVLAARRA